jgi:ATP-dependent protease ClpP protease subunit
MRLLLFPLLLLQTFCAHTQSIEQEPLDPAVTITASSVQSKDRYYVPKIKFDVAVDDDVVQHTINIIDEVTKAGAKAIIIEINTPGGSVDAGFRLSKVIEDSPVPVVCVVDGEAASMGMYILQSCHKRLMTKRSSLMIHEAAIGAEEFYGHEVKWRSIADRLSALNRAIVEHISKRMNVPPSKMLAKISGGYQWWMNHKEALATKAVDSVVVDVKSVTKSYRDTLDLP